MKEKINKEIDVHDLKRQVDSFLDATVDARTMSERDKDFYDGYQWTEQEIQTLRKRNQAPIVVNRVKPKVEGLKGLLSIRATDIKAFPRNKKDEKSAHAVTDALRYVAENNDFDNIKLDVFENKIIQGYGAAITEIELNKKGEPQIKINRIPWDRFYYDPHSYRKDFKDSKFMGQMLWMDREDVKNIFPDADLDLLEDQSAAEDETFEDKPRWFLKQDGRIRIRIAQHYFMKKNIWHVAAFTDSVFLAEPQVSPFLDEEGEPSNPIEADSAYIDRNNLRYSEVRNFIDQQNEINHRRSKALHLLSSRQTKSRKGAIDDVPALKRELAKPDGHIEVNGDGGDFEVLNTSDFTIGQFELYKDAKAELDAVSLNAQLAGERQQGDLSGVAINKLQSAGAMEINSLYNGTAGWEKRIYRQIWARIKQFWNEEKWIRITEDQDNLRWVGLNTQITLQKFLEERINDESQSLEVRTGAAAAFQVLLKTQDPRLQTIVDINNGTAEMDVDIILEQSFDVINIQQEQFQIIAQFAQSSKDIDIIELIDLSQLRNKDQLIEKIEQRRAAAAQAAGNLAQSESQKLQVGNAKTFAEAQVSTEKAKQTAIENQILVTDPNRISSISV